MTAFGAFTGGSNNSYSFYSQEEIPTSAKNKKWEDDAFVSHTGEKLKLISETGKMLSVVFHSRVYLYHLKLLPD